MALTESDQRKGGLKSVETRRRQALERAQTVELVDQVAEHMEREKIGPKFLQLAIELAERAGDAQITPETALEVKQLVDAAHILHKMGRLELGESTANTITFAVDGDREAQLRTLKARLAAVDGQAGQVEGKQE